MPSTRFSLRHCRIRACHPEPACRRQGAQPAVKGAQRTICSFLALLASFLVLFANPAFAQDSPDSLASRIQKILDRPEFTHASFGIEFYDLASGKIL